MPNPQSEIQKLSVIIPVYNEERTIVPLLELVLAAPLSVEREIIVVDDGSTDRSAQLIEEFLSWYPVAPITFFRKQNGGKGSAVKLGLQHATGDLVIIQDADLEYDPNEYQKCIQPILDGKANVVYGSRRLDLSNRQYSSLRFYICGGRTVTAVTNLLYGAHLTDVPTCYKVFRRAVLDNIVIEGDRFEFEYEITAKLLRMGERIFDVPIKYFPRTKSEGKKIGWWDGIEAITTLLRYRSWSPRMPNVLHTIRSTELESGQWGTFAIWILFVFWFYMQQFEPIIGLFVHALRQRLGLP